MSAIAWWIVPAVATLAAMAWARWAARPRRPQGVTESVEHYRRVRAAMAQTSARSRSTANRGRRRGA
jgi:hypothetical protein